MDCQKPNYNVAIRLVLEHIVHLLSTFKRLGIILDLSLYCQKGSLKEKIRVNMYLYLRMNVNFYSILDTQNEITSQTD